MPEIGCACVCISNNSCFKTMVAVLDLPCDTSCLRWLEKHVEAACLMRRSTSKRVNAEPCLYFKRKLEKEAVIRQSLEDGMLVYADIGPVF